MLELLLVPQSMTCSTLFKSMQQLLDVLSKSTAKQYASLIKMESLRPCYPRIFPTDLINGGKLSQLIKMELRFTLEMLFVKLVVNNAVEKSPTFIETTFS